MNIFVTNKNPKVIAQQLDDTRLIEMLVGSAYLISTTMTLQGTTAGPLKPIRTSHICRLWVGQSFSNFLWTVDYFTALCDEYQYRFDKEHKYAQYVDLFEDCTADFVSEFDNKNELTPFVNCTIFKEETNTFRAYRDYLNRKWLLDKEPKWTKRSKPVWNE